ncbi:MAG: SDR family NAD(P)-dependent oxidoreductase [Firmicutes bacterium]|nr:SDR family NAD(P)-dependent oxidoreductase [Bacillota bacterium]
MSFVHGSGASPSQEGVEKCPGCLAGRRALIAGSTRGIGLGLAERFLREGARVAINSETDDDDAAAARARLQTYGATTTYIAADVSVSHEAARLVEAAVSCLGGLDLLWTTHRGGRWDLLK